MLVAKIIQGAISALGKAWHRFTPNKSRKPICTIHIDTLSNLELSAFMESQRMKKLESDYHVLFISDGVVVEVHDKPELVKEELSCCPEPKNGIKTWNVYNENGDFVAGTG